MIWVCSDWHFSHDKEFIWKVRGFNSVTEMNEEIIKRHNSVVAEDDDVYVLGDLCLGSDTDTNKTFIESLNGKIHIVFGNHDTTKRVEMYESCKNVVEICGYATVLKYNKYIFYLSHYPTSTSNYDEDKPLRACVLNICGHVHTTDKYLEMKQGQKSYHVEMEANNCYPTSLDKIIEDFNFLSHKCDCGGTCGGNCKCKNNS